MIEDTEITTGIGLTNSTNPDQTTTLGETLQTTVMTIVVTIAITTIVVVVDLIELVDFNNFKLILN